MLPTSLDTVSVFRLCFGCRFSGEAGKVLRGYVSSTHPVKRRISLHLGWILGSSSLLPWCSGLCRLQACAVHLNGSSTHWQRYLAYLTDVLLAGDSPEGSRTLRTVMSERRRLYFFRPRKQQVLSICGFLLKAVVQRITRLISISLLLCCGEWVEEESVISTETEIDFRVSGNQSLWNLNLPPPGRL